ncbi:hypothetical protein, partial [Serratia marcescens]|uniref:hypothetical protein n=1 Tax=Serratia marcescens TaxID=615 RepID=UPI0028148626
FDERFTSIVNELSNLGKTFENRELALKVMRSLPREWDMKTMIMRESKNLKRMELQELFEELEGVRI